MPIVTVKNKYQVVIPRRVREQVGVAIGDVLEARAVRGKIVFEPKSIVDRGIAEGLDDIKQGRVYGPYRTAAEAMKAFQARSAKLSKRPKRAAS
ncbi:MAG: AbrB/MazE/SpoVT family DNA-binding domain-containing protein [Bryobacteraceae bacterium]|jgi:AbrB family looped-hinge helix DNA binding protein